MKRRRRLLLVVVAVALTACGSQARNDARDSLIKQLKDGGLDQQVAECVVDAFFQNKSDDELQGFFDRPELTPEEAAEFAALGKRCTPDTSTPSG